jgi:hypothetical protein
MTAMDIIVEAGGNARLIYDESLDLSAIGSVTIRRGSHVEPNSNGEWTADLSPVNGPTLGPFSSRSEALSAEVAWLREHWLIPSGE